MAETERLDGRDGKIWSSYVGGASQDAIAAEHGISQQRVSQVLAEVREGIGGAERIDAALLAQERAHALLAAVWPAAMSGDTKAVHAALKVLERQARALGTDATEPLKVSFERHLDDQGALVAEALGAALNVLGLSPDQRELAGRAAQAALLGEELPTPPAPVLEVPADARAGMEDRLRAMTADDGVDVDALLAEVDGEGRGRG
jgi:predicted transcriptional regulator